MNRFSRLFDTVKYLKPIQIRSRLYYAMRGKWQKMSGFAYPSSLPSHSAVLELAPSIPSPVSYRDGTFTFLNLSHTFENRIDWNHAGYGKLWTYNLTYFDFLQQEGISTDAGLALIRDFIDQSKSVKDGLEPFPISLRGINWIKFLTRHDIKEQAIDDSLYAQYCRLMDNLEYHLLGNHLLENGFSLLFGAYYFQDEKFYAKAKDILESELEEQVLSDGAHFELSPMYHQIMLYRVLDCLNLVQNNPWMAVASQQSIADSRWLMEFLEKKAVKMLGWLNAITYENGDIPLLNDSANGIAPTTAQLNDYAARLQLNHISHPEPDSGSMEANRFRIKSGMTILKESGYRKYQNGSYECVIDIGPIGPDYIPGHAHADTFNFELSLNTQHSKLKTSSVPFIVDTGLSTYETGKRRDIERSTSAHNTVEVEGKNSSEVWGGFRVAERAKIVELKEEGNVVTATHDGYKKFGILHTRIWRFDKDKIIIEDVLSKECSAVARLHFHPDVTEEMIKKHITINHRLSTIDSYDYASEFNKTQKALVMEIPFTKELKVEIIL